MLKGVPAILSPALLKVLCEMGHGDEIVIADGNFPAESMGKDAIVIRADGHGVPEILDAVLRMIPLDQYVEQPAALMQVVPGDPCVPEIWDTYRTSSPLITLIDPDRQTDIVRALVNIYKELSSDIGADMSGASGDLTGWAKQGVLLLNATLTVRAGQSDAHSGCGWQTFTDAVIKLLGKREKPLVFILWGSRAQKKREFIQPQHCVIASAHPSPLSAYNGFFGSRPFSRANAFLVGHGLSPVDWTEVSAYDKPIYYEGKGRIERG